MDRISPEARSRVMSRIKGKDTSPEIVLRKALWSAGVRGYRLHCNLHGKPDIVFANKRVVIFVDGDFWHGYLWRKLHKVPPKKYWQEKIRGNIRRDKENNELLRDEGWRILRFWEHEVKNNPKECIKKIVKYL